MDIAAMLDTAMIAFSLATFCALSNLVHVIVCERVDSVLTLSQNHWSLLVLHRCCLLLTC